LFAFGNHGLTYTKWHAEGECGTLFYVSKYWKPLAMSSGVFKGRRARHLPQAPP